VTENKPDWADELARDVLAELLVMLGATSSAETRRLLAMRLRLVKEQGFGKGLDAAVAIVRGDGADASKMPGSPRPEHVSAGDLHSSDA
jgi:hypothetical protein